MKQQKPIRVIQFGLGAMGSMMAKIMLQKKSIHLVAVIVHNPEHNTKDLAEVLNLPKKTGIKVFSNAEECYKKVKADVMLHAAVSYGPEVWKQIAPAVKKGINVITIAEEMGYPFVKYPKLCKEIDATAKKHKVSILGTGINPGFAMDLMPIILSGICAEVKSIQVTRVIDFSPFGPAIQKNIGIGMEENEFNKLVKQKKLPLHIGLPESCYQLAAALNWKIDNIKETREPIVAERTIIIPEYKTIHQGQVAGFNHRCYAYRKGNTIITLEELGRVDPNINYQNTIIIEGNPRLIETINVPPGNLTTTSHAVNLIPIVCNAKPGLLTMKDVLPAGVIN